MVLVEKKKDHPDSFVYKFHVRIQKDLPVGVQLWQQFSIRREDRNTT